VTDEQVDRIIGAIDRLATAAEGLRDAVLATASLNPADVELAELVTAARMRLGDRVLTTDGDG
jgi:hypothetical protein